jgi:hypothetical protein
MIQRNIRTPIMHRAVEANGFVYIGGTIADDTSVSMGEQTRNILGKIAGYLKEAGTDATNLRHRPFAKEGNGCDLDRVLRQQSAGPGHSRRCGSWRRRLD